MKITQAEFVISNTDYLKCPAPDKAEYAFIGRSNVGKSSLINMLTNKNKLAKTSTTPGKTQLINHFLINESWYLVDLPGYGWARVGKKEREKWDKMVKDYLSKRENLYSAFVLVDSRHPPQPVDIEFINWVGSKGIPMSIIFTKSDKQSINKTQSNIALFRTVLKKSWDAMPPMFLSSATDKTGRDEILNYIDQINQDLK
jgi:GTP-binding protein